MPPVQLNTALNRCQANQKSGESVGKNTFIWTMMRPETLACLLLVTGALANNKGKQKRMWGCVVRWRCVTMEIGTNTSEGSEDWNSTQKEHESYRIILKGTTVILLESKRTF